MNTFKIVLGVILLALSFSFAAPITACGVISAPGGYTVTNDLVSTTGDCITVQADNVQLYGQGHSISGSDTGYAIYVAEGHSNILIDGFVAEDSLSGIRVGGLGAETSNVALTHNTARNNGFAGFELIRMVDSTVAGNTAPGNYHGIYMTESTGNTISGNAANGNTYWGHYLGSCSGNTYTSNTAMHNGDIGFFVFSNSDDNVFDSNTASGNGEGFHLSGAGSAVPERNRLTGNTVNENYKTGIFVEGTDATQLYGNSIGLNGYEGIEVALGRDTQIVSNTIRGNSRFGGNGQVNLRYAMNYYMYDNTVTGPGRGVGMDTNAYGTFQHNTISDCSTAITLMSSGNHVADNVVQDCEVALYSWDYSGATEIAGLHMRQGVREVDVSLLYDHGTGNGFKIGLAPVPAHAPYGYTDVKDKCFQVTELGIVDLNLYTDWPDSISSALGVEDSAIKAFRYDGGWVEVPGGHNTDGHKLYLKHMNDFGTFCLFAEKQLPTPPEPPVIPPEDNETDDGGSSGGTTSGGSTGGSGGTTHSGSGGAVHVGVPYVASSGGTGTSFGGEATPSCTSDSDCASSATCSGGICTALEAGSACGTFENHAWVDFECCDTSDCSAGEVCKDNACTPLEPLVITASEGTNTVASDEGIGRLLADVPWWVLTLLLLMVGGGIYARYAMGREEPPEGEEGGEELPPAGEEGE